MFQRTVVTLISDPIHIGVPLVHVVDILAVVSFIEDTCRAQGTGQGWSVQLLGFQPTAHPEPRLERTQVRVVPTAYRPAAIRECLTVPIDVCSTGVSLPVVVCVGLVWVVVVGAVVTAVSHIISVIVILGWVVVEWAVVLQKNGAFYDTVHTTRPIPRWSVTSNCNHVGHFLFTPSLGG